MLLLPRSELSSSTTPRVTTATTSVTTIRSNHTSTTSTYIQVAQLSMAEGDDANSPASNGSGNIDNNGSGPPSVRRSVSTAPPKKTLTKKHRSASWSDRRHNAKLRSNKLTVAVGRPTVAEAQGMRVELTLRGQFSSRGIHHPTAAASSPSSSSSGAPRPPLGTVAASTSPRVLTECTGDTTFTLKVLPARPHASVASGDRGGGRGSAKKRSSSSSSSKQKEDRATLQQQLDTTLSIEMCSVRGGTWVDGVLRKSVCAVRYVCFVGLFCLFGALWLHKVMMW